MNYKNFKEKFVLIGDKKFEIFFSEESLKPYIKIGWYDYKIYFNILEEEKEIYYAIFEDIDIKKAMSKDDEIDFDFKHNKNTCDWFENECYSDIFKYENKNKKIIVFNKCDDCGEILFENSEMYTCCNCGTVACDNCFYSDWNTCDFCQSDYCNSCNDLNYSDLLEKTFCDDDECIDRKDQEEEEQEEEQETRY